VRERYTSHLHPGKFEGEGPMTEYFYDLALDGEFDEEAGSVEWGGRCARFGKRVLLEDDRGFVTLRKFSSPREAKAFVRGFQ
jgi:hypothetical protein